MIKEAMELISLGMECDLSDLDDAMEGAFSALFVAACQHMTKEFAAWDGEPEESDPGVSDDDAADLGRDLASTMSEFHRPESGDVPFPTGDVEGTPV